jgi:hypothetical protein
MGVLLSLGKWIIGAVTSVGVGGVLLHLGLSPERWVADMISSTHPWADVFFWLVVGLLGTVAVRIAIWALWDRRPKAITVGIDEDNFSNARPPRVVKDNVVPALVMLGAFVLLGAGLSYTFKFDQKEALETNSRDNMVEVYDEYFYNEKVVLDWHSYIDCTFENVTFVYNGGPVNFRHNTVRGDRNFASGNPDVNEVIALLKGFHLLSPRLKLVGF